MTDSHFSEPSMRKFRCHFPLSKLLFDTWWLYLFHHLSADKDPLPAAMLQWLHPAKREDQQQPPVWAVFLWERLAEVGGGVWGHSAGRRCSMRRGTVVYSDVPRHHESLRGQHRHYRFRLCTTIQLSQRSNGKHSWRLVNIAVECLSMITLYRIIWAVQNKSKSFVFVAY